MASSSTGAELLGVDLRLSHRRGRHEPDHPAGVHPRRPSPSSSTTSPGHAHRRLRAEPELLLLERHGPRVLGHRPRRPPYLGQGDQGALRRLGAQPEAQVPHPDERPLAAAWEIAFNDIRTTLQTLYALFDNCNSLHTNAYDEAITTHRVVPPSISSSSTRSSTSRRAKTLQGSFIVEELCRSRRGGRDERVPLALRAWRRARRDGQIAQHSKIQEESLHYEHLKHAGELPIVVNTFLDSKGSPTSSPRSHSLDRGGEAVRHREPRGVPGPRRRAGASRSRRCRTSRCPAGTPSRRCSRSPRRQASGHVRGPLRVGGQYRRNM